MLACSSPLTASCGHEVLSRNNAPQVLRTGGRGSWPRASRRSGDSGRAPTQRGPLGLRRACTQRRRALPRPRSQRMRWTWLEVLPTSAVRGGRGGEEYRFAVPAAAGRATAAERPRPERCGGGGLRPSTEALQRLPHLRCGAPSRPPPPPPPPPPPRHARALGRRSRASVIR